MSPMSDEEAEDAGWNDRFAYEDEPLPSIFTDAGLDGDALNSAIDVLRMKQAQPHHSMQTILWEAIKDYAERAHERAKS